MLSAVITAASLFTAAPCALEGMPDAEAKLGVECGWVTVRREPSNPASKPLRLWAARVKADQATNEKPDPILYIHGGPGIATVDAMLPYVREAKSLVEMRKDRDILMFDQRGTGRSEEKLCPDLGGKLKAMSDEGLSPEQEDGRGRELFVECRRALEQAGISTANYSTAITVADIEAVRKAFGIERWNLLSVSYGSLVALHAMRTNPQSIRSVILNSPYPPNSVSWAEQASIAAGSYDAIDRACAAQDQCRKRFGSLVPKLEATLARLEEQPLVDGKRRITGRLFAQALWPLAVQSSTVRFVPLAIDRAHAGDAEVIKGVVRTFASGDTFGGVSPALMMAIGCHESGRTRDWYDRAKALYPGMVSAAPSDSLDRLCTAFRPGFANAAFFAPVASSIPTLLYAGTLDAATPVVDAYQAMRFLPRATLVEVEGASHAPLSRDECTRGIAAAFLADPERAPDLACVARRPPIAFAEDGLTELFAPAQ